jgi:dTDP-glucose 4,6-dehydratase
VRYAIDSSKIISDLGWKPMIKFEDGILKTVKWYLENKKWVELVTRK